MKTLELPALMENLDLLLDFIIEGLSEAVTDKKGLYQIRLACEEVIVNVIHYAYPEGEGTVSVSYEVAADMSALTLVIADAGVPFDPLQKDDPDIGLSLEERQIGGLGIFMVKTIMDEVSYQRENERNILTLKKTLRK